MKYRFLIYGLLGWTMEIFWTGLGSLLRGDFRLQGFSYLWMFPIYGLAVFLEPVHDHIRNLTWVIRGSIWTTVIFGIELITGLAIELTVGKVPWDYTGSSYYSIAGLIRLDYAPVWFVVGLLFEKVDDFMRTKIHL
ncbi:MAG: hypothetical protein WC834_04300 [Eubacteriales bacterium]|nr:MAG: hypothetical protein CVV03_04510 [Firmicutes bacterium HGW-Firmicutes-8]